MVTLVGVVVPMIGGGIPMLARLIPMTGLPIPPIGGPVPQRARLVSFHPGRPSIDRARRAEPRHDDGERHGDEEDG